MLFLVSKPLGHPVNDHRFQIHVLLVFTKTDLKSSRSLSELKSLMRMDRIRADAAASRPRPRPLTLTEVTFSMVTKENVAEIYAWAMQFAAPKDAGTQQQQQQHGVSIVGPDGRPM